jgi:two-component system response regulator
MSIAGATTNLLLVDDDPIAAAITERALESAPADINLRIAGDGLEAYRYINGSGLYADRAAYPLPDVILLDIHMPRFGGLEFLGWLRQNAPEHSRSTPVIIVSGSSPPEELERARALGARMLVPKPVHWPDLWNELLAAGLLKTEAAARH